ncbi:hypothetical protein DQ04_02141070 [Trypanosoma grayi]|uniref:hypothetical protein n=1 Tax=Trypanosoma grayi TaxID=71804 RepID=UPI0004F40A74|nr:hypothetical protein DQ04_02141070 [Trypanosoma grayi]KEG11929.1 hypothetical protein DQ04_02141070 [Trypanosoma grayi]
MSIPSRDAACLAAIIDSVLLAVREEPVAEGRVVDLLLLIPQVLRADPAALRIAYLFTICRPLATVTRLLHPSLQSSRINAAAMQTLLEVLTWCLELHDFADAIGPALTADLVEANALYAVLDALLNGGNDALRADAAELLLVLVARVPPLGHALGGVADALWRISAIVLCPDAAPSMCGEYLAGVLRVVAGMDAAVLPTAFVRDGLAFLAARCEEPSRVVVLVAECVEIATTHRPVQYLQQVGAGEIVPLHSVVAAVRGAEKRQRNGLLSLLAALLQVEGAARVADVDCETAAYSAVLHDKKLWTSQEALVDGLDVVLCAVGCVVTEAVHVHVASAFVRAFPLLCRIILEGVQEARERAALVVGLVLVKNPQVRATVLDLTRNYVEWSMDLLRCTTRSFADAGLAGLAIIDATCAVLNDPVLLPQGDGADLGKWADSVLTLQETRVPYNGLQHGVDEALERVRAAATAPHNTLFVACSKALLAKACEKSLVDPTATAADADAAANTKGGTGYDQWLSRHNRVPRRQLARSPSARGRAGAGPAQKRRTASESKSRSDGALSMTVLCHLPLVFGTYYNRAQRGSSRRQLHGPNGVVTQKLHRSLQSTWNMADVLSGELYSFFLPFCELTLERVEGEALAVERLTRDLSRKLVTTPTAQRGRRWFLTDMVNNILPKTELLIRDLADMLQRHGHDSVVYQLGLIRLLDSNSPGDDDSGGGGGTGAAATAVVVVAGTRVPREITVLSHSVFRDVVHSGNLMYCISRLRQRFSGNM